MVAHASDGEVDSSSPERNHKVTRVIGELPIAQYSGSPRRYGIRENPQLPTLLSSPSVYMAPRPGFPQRVLPTTPNRKEVQQSQHLRVTYFHVRKTIFSEGRYLFGNDN